MKKIILLILVLALSFTLFACNDDNPPDIPPDNPPAGTEPENPPEEPEQFEDKELPRDEFD